MSLLPHLFWPHHSNNQRARILHPSALGILIGFFAIFQVLLTQVTRYNPDILGYASQISPSEIVRLTNLKRAESGLGSLRFDSQLSAAAAQKAADMFAKNYWAHTSPTGTPPWYFISQSGYVYRYAGENLARDFADPVSVVNAWMNSPTHRENLLSNRYSDIGVAVIDGSLGGRDTTLVVQMFGTRTSSGTTAQVSGVSAKTLAKSPVVVPTATPVPTIIVSPSPAPESSTASPIIARTSQPPISPFDLSRAVSLTILGIISVVLLADVIVVNQKKLYRWTSKSMAHFIFIGVLIVAATTLIRGQIL